MICDPQSRFNLPGRKPRSREVTSINGDAQLLAEPDLELAPGTWPHGDLGLNDWAEDIGPEGMGVEIWSPSR